MSSLCPVLCLFAFICFLWFEQEIHRMVLVNIVWGVNNYNWPFLRLNCDFYKKLFSSIWASKLSVHHTCIFLVLQNVQFPALRLGAFVSDRRKESTNTSSSFVISSDNSRLRDAGDDVAITYETRLFVRWTVPSLVNFPSDVLENTCRHDHHLSFSKQINTLINTGSK